MKGNIADKVYFRIEEKLYKEFKKFHLDFLEATEYYEVQDIKKFFALLIAEWEAHYIAENKLEVADAEKIDYINRKGKRIGQLDYEGETARITFHFKKDITKKWNNIIYTLMKEDNFDNMKKYSNGYFFPHFFEFVKSQKDRFIDEFRKRIYEEYTVKKEEKATIRFINKDTIKNISGKITRIEDTPNGLVLFIDRN